MIKQMFLNPTVMVQQIINEYLCKVELTMNRGKHNVFRHRTGTAVAYRSGRSDARARRADTLLQRAALPALFLASVSALL